MKKLKKTFLMISLLVLCISIWPANASTPWKTVPPKDYVTFNWSNEPLKQFWVNNSHINCWFDGTQGGLLVDLYHKSNPTKDLMEDDKMVVTGPVIGSQSSKTGVKSVSVTYTNLSRSFAKLVVSSVDIGENLNFTYTYYIADSESIMVDYRVTFLRDVSVTSISHEFAPNYTASKGSFLAFMNSSGYLNTWKLTADSSYTNFGNSTARTFPLGEDWMAIWNTTRNVCVGQIYTNNSKLLNPLNRTLVGLWDAPGETAAWYSKWYNGPATSIPLGSVFEDTVLLWFGTGDYTDVKNLAGMAEEILDPELWTEVSPKNYVTFNWVSQANKQFWVNNSYIRCFFDGTKGGSLVNVYHKSDLTYDFIYHDQIVIRAAQPISSRDHVPIGNINVSYTQVSPSFAKLVIVGISPRGVNFTKVYHFGDSEAVRVDIKATFLKDISADEMGHELIVHATTKSHLAHVDYNNNLKMWNITGSGFDFLAQYTAGEFPLAENWISVWDPTQNVCVGQIYLNQSMLNPLNGTAIALWDNVNVEGIVALCNRWWQGGGYKDMPNGSVLEDQVLYWFDTGDYMDVKNKDGTISELMLYTPPPPPPPRRTLREKWCYWTDLDNKRCWINTSYIRCFFDGTQGGALVDVHHISDLTKDLIDDDKMKVEGPGLWQSSRWGIPIENVSADYTQVSSSLGIFVVTSIVQPFNFTYIYYFTNSEAIKVHHKVTFLKDTNVTQIGHELVAGYLASVGSDVAYVNSTGQLNTWKLTASGNETILANSTAGTFPMAEDWIAVWNTTRNLCAGIIYYDQSMLLTPLGNTTIGVWDNAGEEKAALFSRWYQATNATLVSAGSEFEDTVLFWFGTGDYTDVRDLAPLIDGIPGRITWNLTTLYKAGLEVNKTFLRGANLTVKFYSYNGAYQGSTTWNITTPTLVDLSRIATHPLGKPVENATLVLTDNLGNVLYTVDGFVVDRTDLMIRATDIDNAWPTASVAQRQAYMDELAAIDLQWPYAPTTWEYDP